MQILAQKNENFYAESRKMGLYGDKNVPKMQNILSDTIRH